MNNANWQSGIHFSLRSHLKVLLTPLRVSKTEGEPTATKRKFCRQMERQSHRYPGVQCGRSYRGWNWSQTLKNLMWRALKYAVSRDKAQRLDLQILKNDLGKNLALIWATLRRHCSLALQESRGSSAFHHEHWPLFHQKALQALTALLSPEFCNPDHSSGSLR